MMNLGWKTILGGALIAAGQIFGAAAVDFPIASWIIWFKWASNFCTAAGSVFAAIGVSSKVANATNIGVDAVNKLNYQLKEAIGKQRIVIQEKEKRIPYIVKQVNPGDIIKVKKPSGEVETILTPDNEDFKK